MIGEAAAAFRGMAGTAGAVRSAALATAIATALASGLAFAQAAPAEQAPASATAFRALGPEAAALAALVEGEADTVVRDFYAARGFAPLWTGSEGAETARALALLASLAEAHTHALPAARYDVEGLAQALSDARHAGPEVRAAAELRMTAAYLRYARDLVSGALEPRRVDPELKLRPERPDPAALLHLIADAAEPARALAHLAPAHPDYARLRARLADYVRLARSNAWAEALPEGPSLREGDRSERVALLRQRLIAMGDLDPRAEQQAVADRTQVAANETTTDLPERPAKDPRVFDWAVAEAVERFQTRHGLNTDGVVGPATRAALNVDPAKRARQIAVNLERLRWLNRDLGRRHILVNLAGYEMALMEDGAPIFTSRVVIGKAQRHRTPEFSNEMDHMVVNPTWFVPSSIAREEILPKLQQNPFYLSERNMRLVGSAVDPALIDWSYVTPATFPGRIRQGPGPDNALGKVKFMFPNDHAIYLHDTPQKSLFLRDRRAYSHGCVRVQKPFELAYHLLSAQRDDAQAYFDRLVANGREVYVHLDEHLPVHITYRTAWVDDTGADQFRDDVYGRDARVFAALADAGLAFDAR